MVAVTVKDCEKKDLRLAHNKRTVALNAKVNQKTADAIVSIGAKLPKATKTDDAVNQIIENAIAYYAKLVREGVKVG